MFGEIALLDGQPRSADASAIEDTTLLVVERRHFLPFLRQNEDLYLRLLAVLCERLRRTSMALEAIALLDLPAQPRPPAAETRPGITAARRPAACAIDMKLSQRDLSTLVASTRESVNKQLRVWRETGVVDSGGSARVAPSRRIEAPDRLEVTASTIRTFVHTAAGGPNQTLTRRGACRCSASMLRRLIFAVLISLVPAASACAQTATAAQDRYFTTSDGVRLHYLEAGGHAAHTIVFVPGWTMPAWISAPQIAGIRPALPRDRLRSARPGRVRGRRRAATSRSAAARTSPS